MDELVKDNKSLGTTLGSNSELPDCCRESCNFSFAERQKSVVRHTSARTLPFEWVELFSVDLLLVIRDAVFWNVRFDFLRFHQRTDPIIMIVLLRRLGPFLYSRT